MKHPHLPILLSTILSVLLLITFPATAANTDKYNHGEPHYGGIVSIVDGFHHELVLKEEGKVILYVAGLPTGDKLKTVMVRLIILQGQEKQSLEMVLTKDDQQRFEAPIAAPLKTNDKVIALINIGAKKMRMVRFEITKEK